jgi:hypothetical protein
MNRAKEERVNEDEIHSFARTTNDVALRESALALLAEVERLRKIEEAARATHDLGENCAEGLCPLCEALAVVRRSRGGSAEEPKL